MVRGFIRLSLIASFALACSKAGNGRPASSGSTAGARAPAPASPGRPAPGGDASSVQGSNGGSGVGTARDAANVFFSGHSAFEVTMPAMVDQIARALGRTHHYNLQMGIGSSMTLRLSGNGMEQDRDGHRLPFTVAEEISSATTIGEGNEYDTLVVTESVRLLPALLYNDSIGSLRRFYDLLMQSDPAGKVYLFDTWEEVEANDHAAWIAETRAQQVIWQCLASAVNRDPAVARNPIQMLPSGLALARAAEEAAQGSLPGVTGPSQLFGDMIHPSTLGHYYMALVVYASVYRRSPAGAPTEFDTPHGRLAGFVSDETAARLQALAFEVVSDFYAQPSPALRSMEECRAAVRVFCDTQECMTRVDQRFAN